MTRDVAADLAERYGVPIEAARDAVARGLVGRCQDAADRAATPARAFVEALTAPAPEPLRVTLADLMRAKGGAG